MYLWRDIQTKAGYSDAMVRYRNSLAREINFIFSPRYKKVEEDLIKWSRWFEKGENLIKKTEISEHICVSTVFLGMGSIPYDKLLFETMIFGGEHDEYQERYATLEEAKEGHNRAIEMCGGLTAFAIKMYLKNK